MPDERARGAVDDVHRPRLLLLGGSGQVGGDLLPQLSPGHDVRAPSHAELDLADFDRLRYAVRAWRPAVIVNAAAITNVDQAEQDRETARRLNAEAPGVLAEEAGRLGAFLVHYSTDYVFDGAMARPYHEEDEPSPVNYYGLTKLHGEEAIRRSGAAHLIVRTSWVYGARGRNFFSTIASLVRERDVVELVVDQVGSPTWSRRVAEVTAGVLERLASKGWAASPGILHVAGGGHATRYEFAEAVARRTTGARARLLPVTSDQFPRAARRPHYSVLDTSRLRDQFGIIMPDWREELATLPRD